MTRTRWHAGAPSAVAILVAISTGCDRQIAAPTLQPTPELAPPEVARVIQASGRTGLVAVARAADPETGRLGPYEVVTDAQARARLGLLSPAAAAGEDVAAMDHGGPWYVAQPGARRLDLGQWSTYEMHGADNKRWATWEFYCQQVGPAFRVNRAKVDSLWNTAVANTGGHLPDQHPIAQKPVQEHWRTSGFSDANRVFVDTIWGNIASGDEIYRMTWTDSMPGSPCFGLSKTEVQTVATRYLECCMTPLTARPSFIFATVTSNHGYPFYMEPEFIDQSYTTTENAMAVIGQAIEIEAGSLIYGGLNDVNHNWARPHRYHRTGTDLDIDTQGTRNDQRKFNLLERAGERAGFRNCAPEADHVHCNARAY